MPSGSKGARHQEGELSESRPLDDILHSWNFDNQFYIVLYIMAQRSRISCKNLEISVDWLSVQMVKTKNVAVNHSSRITGRSKITSHRTIYLLSIPEQCKQCYS